MLLRFSKERNRLPSVTLTFVPESATVVYRVSWLSIGRRAVQLTYRNGPIATMSELSNCTQDAAEKVTEVVAPAMLDVGMLNASPAM